VPNYFFQNNGNSGDLDYRYEE